MTNHEAIDLFFLLPPIQFAQKNLPLAVQSSRVLYIPGSVSDIGYGVLYGGIGPRQTRRDPRGR